MSGRSAIEWTQATWNPVVGCKRVSAGCDHCYAFELHDKRHIAWKRGNWDGAPKQYHQPFSHVQLLPERLSDPLHWRKPRRVFVNSMSDLFHEDVPDDFIHGVFLTMMQAPQHIYQILTKRPQRMRDWMRQYAGPASPIRYHLPHIWLGVSVENQAAADERIPLLLETPAAVRFLSCEPLLGPVDLTEYLADRAIVRAIVHHHRTGHHCGGIDDEADCEMCCTQWRDGQPPDLHWIIIGGESGKHARPMDLLWVESLVEQCRNAEIACFVKQLGSVYAKTHGTGDTHAGEMCFWPEALRVREYPSVATD